MTNNRLEWLIENYQKIVGPEVIVNSDTMIRGTSLEKLAQWDGPPFRRISDWITKKLAEQNTTEEIGFAQGNNYDMTLAKIQFDKCFDLMQGRNEKYGDSFKVLRKDSIVDLMLMKLDRCVKQSLDDKAMEVEIEDIVNYGIFALMKIRNENSED